MDVAGRSLNDAAVEVIQPMMNPHQLLREPFFAPILYAIEARIHEADKQARREGISFTDSQVKSVLNKVAAIAMGKAPGIKRRTPKEELLAVLIDTLGKTRKTIRVEDEQAEENRKPLSRGDWVLAIKCVEESLKTRTGGSGSRGYLDYLVGFIEHKRP